MLGSFPFLTGRVGRPAPSSADGAEIAASFGRGGDMIVDQMQGNYSEQCSRGNVFFASAAAITLPAIANNLVSVFAIYNPVDSGKYLELIDADVATVLVTTVVDSVGLYYSSKALTALGTFTTQGVVQNGNLGAAPGVGQFYAAYTHSGTPLLGALLGGYGGTSDNALNLVHYEFKGRVLIPPGVVASLAMTVTAAPSTTNGITLGCSWVERAV